MLREFFYLVEMQFKEAKAYLPAILFFSLLFPVGILVAFGYITASPFKDYIISGTITFYISVGTTLAVAQTIANEREVGRLSLMIASGIPKEVYVISIAISNGLTTLLIVPILIVFGVLLLHIMVLSPLFLVIALVISLFMGIMMGMLIGLGFRTLRQVNQYSQIISFGLSFFAPVYFPYTFIPLPYRYLTLLEPTTYVSQSISLALAGKPSSLLWSLGALIYGILFLFVTNYIITRR